MPAEALDLQAERHARACAKMDDETLVFCMFGLLQPSMSGHHVTAGASATAGVLARVALTEIAARWIPDEVMEPAFRQITEALEGDDG